MSGHLSASAPQPRRRTAPSLGFRFLLANDLHHGEPACDAFFQGLVTQMRTHAAIDFCLLAGDLTDRGLPESLASMRRIFSGLGVLVHTVPGNHDNDTAGDTSLYNREFPEALNRVFHHKGWQFIGLDTTDGTAWQNTRIGPHTLSFLDATVPNLDPRAPTVVFTHFPLAPGVFMRPVNADAALALLAPLNLRAVLCGHFHGRTLHPRGAAILSTGTCCARLRSNHDGTAPEGYQVCTANPDGTVTQDFFEYTPATENPPPPTIALV